MCEQKTEAKAKIDRLIESMDRLSEALLGCRANSHEPKSEPVGGDRLSVAST
jgi:hypothetical protein